MLGQKLQGSALGRRAEEREVLPSVMARISTSTDKVFARKPHRQRYIISACPAGDISKKWVRGRGREGTGDSPGRAVCAQRQDREPQARGQRWVSEMLGW